MLGIRFQTNIYVQRSQCECCLKSWLVYTCVSENLTKTGWTKHTYPNWDILLALYFVLFWLLFVFFSSVLLFVCLFISWLVDLLLLILLFLFCLGVLFCFALLCVVLFCFLQGSEVAILVIRKEPVPLKRRHYLVMSTASNCLRLWFQ